MKDLNGLYYKYFNEVVPSFVAGGKYKTPMAIPKITKVTVNMGLGAVKESKNEFEELVKQLTQITAQKPVITKSRKSIAGFNVREGMNVGAKVTLRGKRMYNFLEKIFNYVLPRTRDFRGLPIRGFDGMGNYTFGLEDQMVFLELDPNKIKRRQGMQVCITTTAKTDAEAKELLVNLGLPLEKKE